MSRARPALSPVSGPFLREVYSRVPEIALESAVLSFAMVSKVALLMTLETCCVVASRLSLQKHSQDEQAPHRACVGACRRPRGALRAARVAKQRLNRPNSTKTQCDASSGPCARLSTSQRVALRPRYEPPPLRPATQQKPPRAAHGSNGGSRPRATQIALPRNGTYGPLALATTLP